MSSAFEVVLPPDPRAAALARRVVQELRGVLSPEVVGDVSLLVTELVANSVRHAGLGGEDRIHVRIQLAADRLAVEVVDDGLGFRPSDRTEGGWGLYLVDRLADRWGIQRDGATVAWFEIDLPPRGRRFRPAGGGVHARRAAGGPPDEPGREGTAMTEERIEEAKGRLKEAAGDLTDDERLEREGKADQAAAKVKGKAKEVVDKAKDAATTVWEKVDDDDDSAEGKGGIAR
jgi:uncharacterized protein YjbJ (UPF0337 family)/anti-sigma regulatory factor (Ser/Thr protein kinase)